MSFYVGDYLLLQDARELKHDRYSWSLPDISSLSGHMGDTSNVEELLIRPEDMTLVPTQVQYGFATWSADEGWEPDHDAYRQFYVRDEAWTEFYPRNEHFYVYDFTATDRWTEFYPRNENFYVYDFTTTDRWTEFYVRASAWTEFYVRNEAFYVRHFNPVSFWIEFYVSDFA